MSRQVHETLNGVNPSSSFRDMRSAKSGPNLWQVWQVFGPWASPQWASPQCTPTGLDNSTELRMEKIHQAVTEIWVPQVWQPPARPPGPWRQYPYSPEGWGVKSQCVKLIHKVKKQQTWNYLHTEIPPRPHTDYMQVSFFSVYALYFVIKLGSPK